MLESFLILLSAGLAAGFVAGLVGVGGGIIFAPVLLFYFQSAGVAEPILTPLTLGTSLLCTLLTSSASTFHHHRRGAVIRNIAIVTGLGSAIGVVTITSLVTTRAWYDQHVFQIVFSVLLTAVAIRMMQSPTRKEDAEMTDSTEIRGTQPARKLIAIGTAAGAVSSAVGVGGGVILVPAFNRLTRLPIHTSVGTSSATIIIISTLGVVTYALSGLSSQTGPHTVGFVDPLTALALSVPAALSTRLGVTTAHRFKRRTLRTGFALFAILVAVRLTVRALSSV